MFKHTGSLATENRDLKRIHQIKALTFEGLKSRDDIITKLKIQLESVNRDMQVTSNNSRLERQKQTSITAKQQYMHEKVKREQQLQLQQQQQQLQQQRQQLQQQQMQQKQRIVKKKNELTYFDNLDERNNGSSTNSEPDNSEMSDNENSDNDYNNNSDADVNSSDAEISRNMQPNKGNYHRRKANQRQRYTPYKKHNRNTHQQRKNVKYSDDNPPVHRHLQSYYDKR